MSLKIGITGASGILGSELKKKIKKNLVIFKGNLTNKTDVYNWVKKNKFKTIYHFAAVVPIKEFNKNKKKSFDVNVTGTKHLVDSILKFQNNKIWFFYSSTSHVYKLNKKNAKIKETDICKPQNHYGLSKRLAEKYLIKKFTENKYKYCIGRIFSFTHKNQQKTFFIPAIIERLLGSKNKNYNKINNANHFRDFLSTKDIINAIVILEREKKVGIFNIGSGIKTHLFDIINYLGAVIKIRVKMNLGSKKTFLIANNNKLKKIGWKKKYNFLTEINGILRYKILKKNRSVQG